MRYDLFDYQREAAVSILKRLDAARDLWTQHGDAVVVRPVCGYGVG